MLTILILSCTSPDKIVQDTDTVTDIRPVIIIGGGASGLAARDPLARIGDFSTYTGKETELGGAEIMLDDSLPSIPTGNNISISLIQQTLL